MGSAPDTTVRMNRILLADDSPHAQRMGERILRDEGYEVVSVTDGETALLRMEDVDPDLVVADVFLPGRSGLDICSYLKTEPAHRHVRIVLTAGMLEPFDEDQARAAGADAIIKKPFEASVVLETLKPLVAAAQKDRAAADDAAWVEPPAAEAAKEDPPAPAPAHAPLLAVVPPPPLPAPPAKPELVSERPVRTLRADPDLPKTEPRRPIEPPPAPALDPEPELLPSGTGVSEEELLRAAVTLALDAAFPALVDDITAKVLRNLRTAGNEAPGGDPEPGAIPIPVSPIPNDHS
jgi:CheY-like chemotaxis protein